MRTLLCAAAAAVALGLAGCEAGQDAPVTETEEPTIGAAPDTLGSPETPATAALPNTGIPEPLTDPEFVRLAKLANQLEIESSELALEKTRTPAVRAYAQNMVEDHTQLGQQIERIVATANIADVTGSDPLNTEAVMARLRAADGAAFDQAYKLAQIEAHEWTIELFEQASGEDGLTDTLEQTADGALPLLRQHLEGARTLVVGAEAGPIAP